MSAGRAVIMILVFMLADVLGRTSDGANTLGLAVVILIIKNPYCISNAGFLMSFLAMAGIIFVKPIFSNEETIMLFFRKKKMVSITENVYIPQYHRYADYRLVCSDCNASCCFKHVRTDCHYKSFA